MSRMFAKGGSGMNQIFFLGVVFFDAGLIMAALSLVSSLNDKPYRPKSSLDLKYAQQMDPIINDKMEVKQINN